MRRLIFDCGNLLNNGGKTSQKNIGFGNRLWMRENLQTTFCNRLTDNKIFKKRKNSHPITKI